LLNGGVNGRIGISLLLFLCVGLCAATIGAQTRATLSANIYFTNNTPDNVEQFPIELFTRNRKRRVAQTRPDQQHRFTFSELAPRQYLLKVSWPDRCVLWYRIDLTNKSEFRGRIIMDLACAHSDGRIQDLPEKS
jgi:hypothetical protein